MRIVKRILGIALVSSPFVALGCLITPFKVYALTLGLVLGVVGVIALGVYLIQSS